LGLLIGAMVPLVNFAAVYMLARHGKLGLLREMVRNPLILATLAGFLYSFSGLVLPDPVALILGKLGEAAITLGLLAVKLLVVPAVTLLAAYSLGLRGVYFDTAVLFGALPTATSACILAVRMGGDGSGVAWLISANTLAAMLTLPIWLSIAARF